MTTTATEVLHEPWCTEHVISEDGAQWCATATDLHRVRVEITSDVESLNGGVGIEVYAPGDHYLTPDQAREVAIRLAQAADVVEAASELDPARQRDLADLATRLLAEQRAARLREE